ncbi:MAG: ABC transporter ATP-binding protein [Atribacterota bacterium]|jgi:multiple sugar transport system ATP-binding protein|nr:ABC transporter ATP-binding protein [Atribacterota bacterium]
MVNVELKNVVKKYGDLIAINNLSFKVNSGELMVLLGPPGAGKSSTLKTVAGVEEVTSGEILIDNELVNNFDPADRDVAMAFETYALYPHLSVFENIAFPLRAPKRSRLFSEEAVKEKVLEVARFLEIDMLLERKPKELSGGQRQRVALGRCLIRDPKVFLLDEPIAHLDAKLRYRLRQELKKWQQRKGVTTLYTTTDYLEAFSVADRIVILNKGTLQQVGSWEEIYNHPANTFVGMIVSDPPMNYFDGKLVMDGGKMLMRAKGISFYLPSLTEEKARQMNISEVVLGIFPSKILMSRDENFMPGSGTIVDGVAKFTELRGSRKIVFVQTPQDLSFTIQLPAEAKVQIGEKVRCFFGEDEVQIFDKQSKINLFWV